MTWDEGDIGRGSVMLDFRHAEGTAVDDVAGFYFLGPEKPKQLTGKGPDLLSQVAQWLTGGLRRTLPVCLLSKARKRPCG